MDITDIYRKFYPNTKEYIFFSTPPRNFSTINHIVFTKQTCILSDTDMLNLDFQKQLKRESPHIYGN